MDRKDDYTLFLEALGKTLGDLRKEMGVTQAELGEKSNRGQSAIGKLERGPVPNLPLRVIYEVAHAMPMPLSQVIQMAEQRAEGDIKRRKSSLGPWSDVAKRVEGLPPKKQEWIARIVGDILQN